jgi:signal transduction histidine kinase
VEVSVRAVGERVAVEVSDDGPGLPASLAALTARARKGRGSRGRGLAIASEIAARHGGCVATAPASCGARVVLELPVWRPVVADAGLPAR